MTLHRENPGSDTVWTFHCDVCERQFASNQPGLAAAVDDATANGWIIATMTLCPGCATAAGHDS